MDSDHHPLVVCVRGNNKRERGERGGIRRRGKWNEVDREQFQEKLGVMEEMLKIRKTIAEREEGRMNNKNRRGWWEKKKRERKELRNWRKGRGEVEKYREKKKEYREMCERKKKDEKERIREIREAKTEGKVWKLISRGS